MRRNSDSMSSKSQSDDGNRQESISDDEEDRWPWTSYYSNPKGGEVGLGNLGNTCYFSSALQALLHCPPLIAFALDHLDDNPSNLRAQLVVDFASLVARAWCGEFAVLSPTSLLRSVITINPFFRGYAQHDAQELLRFVIDSMHESLKITCEYNYLHYRFGYGTGEEQEERREQYLNEMKSEQTSNGHSNNALSPSSTSSLPPPSRSSSSTMTPSDSTPSTPPPPKPMRHWPDYSIISDIFAGVLLSTIKCLHCHGLSTAQDPFFDLSLDIPKDTSMKRIQAERGEEALTSTAKQGWLGSALSYVGLTSPPLSLETCLHAFCTSDRLMNTDQYRCDRCAGKVDATKTLSLHKLPEVLTLHIKRFSHNSYFGSKISRHITFPLYGLDMSPYLSNVRPEKPPSKHKKSKKKRVDVEDSHLYDLFAIVRHIGNVGGGHYISYCKHHITNQWYEFDDRMVTEVSEDRVSRVEAYILFYRRRHQPTYAQNILDRVNSIRYTPKDKEANRAVRYISSHWIKKLQILQRIEPIDNRDLACEHGIPRVLPVDGGTRAIPVTEEGWNQLRNLIGGGMEIDGKSNSCKACMIPVIREDERRRISQLDNEATHNASPNSPFYLIHGEWLKKWRSFIGGSNERPGNITNNELFMADLKTPKPDLIKSVDYHGLHGVVWDELLRIYGGGPTIVRRRLDIYDMEGVENGLIEEEKNEAQPSSKYISSRGTNTKTNSGSTTYSPELNGVNHHPSNSEPSESDSMTYELKQHYQL